MPQTTKKRRPPSDPVPGPIAFGDQSQGGAGGTGSVLGGTGPLNSVWEMLKRIGRRPPNVVSGGTFGR